VVGADQLGRVGGAVVGWVELGPAGGERDLGVHLPVDGPDRDREGADRGHDAEGALEGGCVGDDPGRRLQAWTPSGRSSVPSESVTPLVSRASAGRSSAPWPGRCRRTPTPRRSDQQHRDQQAGATRRSDMGVTLSQAGHSPGHGLVTSAVRAGSARDRHKPRSAATPAYRCRHDAGRLGEVDGRAARRGRPGGCRARPAEDQCVLALEEPVAAHATGRPALAGVLGEARHLDRARLGARERGRRAAGVTTTADVASSAPNHTTD
jgi:hypothetical protein